MIELKGIQKAFDGRTVIKDIDAVFETGRTNLIIGQSGSGKTVLLKCVVGLLEPDAGDVIYDGRSLAGMSKQDKVRLRIEMGMLFQGSALFDAMTIEENVRFPLRLFSDLSPLEQERRTHYCLDRVGLKDSHRLYPAEISGGMQKRAAIARAIALNPKYLFCDEPNSGLDPLTSITIDELISDITNEFKMTTVINTHDMNSVLTMGENILFIYQGDKAWEGGRDALYHSDNERLNEFVFASTLMKKP